MAKYDPRLQDEIPGWVIENIMQVSVWMKLQNYTNWSIAGIGPLPEFPQYQVAVSDEMIRIDRT